MLEKSSPGEFTESGMITFTGCFGASPGIYTHPLDKKKVFSSSGLISQAAIWDISCRRIDCLSEELKKASNKMIVLLSG